MQWRVAGGGLAACAVAALVACGTDGSADDDDSAAPVPTVAPGGCGAPEYRWQARDKVGKVVSWAEYPLSPLSAATINSLIQDKTDLFPVLPYGARVFHFRYTTQDRGQVVEATAALAIPWATEGLQQGFPSMLVHHGTTGFANACAPTLLGEDNILALYPLAGLGYIVVAPDYIGMDGESMDVKPSVLQHAYLNVEQTAIGSLDALRAGHALLQDPALLTLLSPDGRVALWGGSQGGHGAFATDLVAPYYAPEFDIRASVALVPPTDLWGLGMYAFSDINPATDAMAAFLVAQHAWYRSTLPLSAVLSDGDPTHLASTLQDAMYSGCDADAAFNAISDVDQVFAPAFLDAVRTGDAAAWAPWSCYAQENSMASPHFPRLRQTPTLFVTGERDPLVYTPTERVDFGRLCSLGFRLEYLECAGAGHTQAGGWSLPEQLAWLEQRLAGQPLDSAKACVLTAPVHCSGQPQ